LPCCTSTRPIMAIAEAICAMRISVVKTCMKETP
jgi:hypothetical protein